MRNVSTRQIPSFCSFFYLMEALKKMSWNYQVVFISNKCLHIQLTILTRHFFFFCSSLALCFYHLIILIPFVSGLGLILLKKQANDKSFAFNDFSFYLSAI